jgi:transcriptional regulator with XRE-family HTH domain
MLSQRLKELRAGSNINQSQLAEYLGVDQSTIGRWENGKREPDLNTLQTLAKYFGVTVNYLLGREDIEVAMFARKLTDVPDEDRAFLLSNLNNTLDVYFKSKGLST